MREYRQSVRGSVSFFAPIDSLAATDIVENAVSAGDENRRIMIDLIREDRSEEPSAFEFYLSGDAVCEVEEHAGSEFDPPEFDARNGIEIDVIKNELHRLLKKYEIDYIDLKEEFEAA